jgi:hypothetical protein
MFGDMTTRTKYLSLCLFSALSLLGLCGCEKVSPIGVLVSGTAVEDRVKMSHLFYQEHKDELKWHLALDRDYTFLVGADSHLTTDGGRLREMLQNGLDHDDVLYAHLGDIADTKAEYYIELENIIHDYKKKYAKKYYKEYFYGDPDEEADRIYESYYMYEDTVAHLDYSLADVPYPFYPVVGNHDITHNGWALWSNIFHSSFYDVYVLVKAEPLTLDHFIFLDSASGTLGKEQVELIEQGVLDGHNEETGGSIFRHTFVFSHTNIFRPSSLQFASTFPREETFYLLDQIQEWNTTMAFFGHVHMWDYREVGGVKYMTLDSMSERNNPDPGDYLVRVHVKKDGTITWEKVHMNYTAK